MLSEQHISRPTVVPASSLIRLVVASVIGTTIEFYDFSLYALAAALVFNKDFFPTCNPLTGISLAFLTYAVGFLVRPIGGMLFGHIGDKHGRRFALVFTLSLMGAATFCMGLLPTFSQVGVLAPVLLTLLRLIQGLECDHDWFSLPDVRLCCPGALSDRLGRRPISLLGAIGIAVWIFFFYNLIGRAAQLLFTAVLIVGLLCHAVIAGCSGALFAALFDTRVRYSGASVGYQFGTVLGGAVAPLIAVRLLEIYKSAVPIAIYVALASMLSIVGVLMAPETRGRNLGDMDR